VFVFFRTLQRYTYTHDEDWVITRLHIFRALCTISKYRVRTDEFYSFHLIIVHRVHRRGAVVYLSTRACSGVCVCVSSIRVDGLKMIFNRYAVF